MTGLAKSTFFEAKLTMRTSDALTEIGILAYPDSQLAAIDGLTTKAAAHGERSSYSSDKKG